MVLIDSAPLLAGQRLDSAVARRSMRWWWWLQPGLKRNVDGRAAAGSGRMPGPLPWLRADRCRTGIRRLLRRLRITATVVAGYPSSRRRRQPPSGQRRRRRPGIAQHVRRRRARPRPRTELALGRDDLPIGGFRAARSVSSSAEIVGAADRVLKIAGAGRSAARPGRPERLHPELALSVHQRLRDRRERSRPSGTLRPRGRDEAHARARRSCDRPRPPPRWCVGTPRSLSRIAGSTHGSRPEIAGHLLEGRDLTSCAYRRHAFVEPCVGDSARWAQRSPASGPPAR